MGILSVIEWMMGWQINPCVWISGNPDWHDYHAVHAHYCMLWVLLRRMAVFRQTLHRDLLNRKYLKLFLSYHFDSKGTSDVWVGNSSAEENSVGLPFKGYSYVIGTFEEALERWDLTSATRVLIAGFSAGAIFHSAVTHQRCLCILRSFSG